MEKRSYNLCSTYVLPMLGLNKFSFGTTTDAFINSYLSDDDRHVVVHTIRPVSSLVANNPAFRFKFDNEGKNYSVFEIPSFYLGDVLKFKEGKYSQFSNPTKEQIRKKSGLNYKVPLAGGGMRSARELLALDKDPELRKAMESELAVKIHVDAELASIPGDDNYFDLKLSNKLEATTY